MYKPNGELFCLILSDGLNGQARTAQMKDGKIVAMYGLSSADESHLGFDALGASAQSEFCLSVIGSIMP
jgi:hypothetical protein